MKENTLLNDAGYPKPSFTREDLLPITAGIYDWKPLDEENLDKILLIASDICQNSEILLGFCNEGKLFFKAFCRPSSKTYEIAKETCQKVIFHNSLIKFVSYEPQSETFFVCLGIPIKRSDGFLMGVVCALDLENQLDKKAESLDLERLENLVSKVLEAVAPVSSKHSINYIKEAALTERRHFQTNSVGKLSNPKSPSKLNAFPSLINTMVKRPAYFPK